MIQITLSELEVLINQHAKLGVDLFATSSDCIFIRIINISAHQILFLVSDCGQRLQFSSVENALNYLICLGFDL